MIAVLAMLAVMPPVPVLTPTRMPPAAARAVLKIFNREQEPVVVVRPRVAKKLAVRSKIKSVEVFK